MAKMCHIFKTNCLVYSSCFMRGLFKSLTEWSRFSPALMRGAASLLKRGSPLRERHSSRTAPQARLRIASLPGGHPTNSRPSYSDSRRGSTSGRVLPRNLAGQRRGTAVAVQLRISGMSGLPTVLLLIVGLLASIEGRVTRAINCSGLRP